MTRALQGASPIPWAHPSVPPEEPGVWPGGVGLDHPCHVGSPPFPAHRWQLFRNPFAFPLWGSQSCALSSVSYAAPWPWERCSGCPPGWGPRWAQPVLAAGRERWLNERRLLCKLQGRAWERRGRKTTVSIQFCISVGRKSDGKVICYCACRCEAGRAQ